MYPNLFLAHMAVPNWFLMVGTGAIVTIALVAYCAPKDFIIRRYELALLTALLIGTGLLGARVLFNILHHADGLKGGFAYFGALALILLTLWAYSNVRKLRFLTLADYGAPFIMLNQAFVRVGCLMAGCCYGKPTHSSYGAIFKPVDGVLRHPTQAYESILLIAIYIIGRHIYVNRRDRPGEALFATLFLYGGGRFFIEFLRVDSPVVFLNITLAQIASLALMLAAFLMRPGRGGFGSIQKSDRAYQSFKVVRKK